MLSLYIYESFKKLKQNPIDFHPSKKIHKLKSTKILLVGMLDSPHFQKWLEVLLREFPDRKILIFPSDRPKSKSRKIKNQVGTTRNSISIFHLLPSRKLNFALYYVFDILFATKWRSYFLARYIIRHRPSIIHFHEMQHGAYLYNQIVNYRKLPQNSRKIISTWGSDLTLYSWVSEHHNQIKTCLSWADIITAEREIELADAIRLGFKGDFRAPVYINVGSNPFELKERIKPSSREIILIKGHQSDTGRALNVLHVISKISGHIKNYEIIVYSAPVSAQIQVDILRNKYNINISTLPKTDHSAMLDLFSRARIAISIAISDGLPGALVEAMQAGAFPIQSSNSAGQEFISPGENGFLVDPWNFKEIEDSIMVALTDNFLVDQASILNDKILQEKFNMHDGVSKLRKLYL